jgi:hypothetical protein
MQAFLWAEQFHAVRNAAHTRNLTNIIITPNNFMQAFLWG